MCPKDLRGEAFTFGGNAIQEMFCAGCPRIKTPGKPDGYVDHEPGAGSHVQKPVISGHTKADDPSDLGVDGCGTGPEVLENPGRRAVAVIG